MRSTETAGRHVDRWGERPSAVISVRPDHQLTLEELRDFLAPRVPTWWLPVALSVVEEVPKTSVGKLDKAMRLPTVSDQLASPAT